MNQWLDSNGLVRTKTMFDSSGNGALYSTLLFILTFDPYFDYHALAGNVRSLWQKDSGVLWRTPQNSYGQESWDNYLGISCLCLYARDYKFARKILWSAIKRFCFMQNSFERGDFWKSQMLRFPQVWTVMIAAAFPISPVFYVSSQALRLLLLFQKINLKDASGTQLQWLQRWALYSMKIDGPMKKFLQNIWNEKGSMRSVMSEYFQEGHPILDGYEEFSARVLSGALR